MWKAYDDNGIFHNGTREECIDAVIERLESDEAEGVYSENKLVDMIHRFNWTMKNESSNFECHGFNVEKVLL